MKDTLLFIDWIVIVGLLVAGLVVSFLFSELAFPIAVFLMPSLIGAVLLTSDQK